MIASAMSRARISAPVSLRWNPSSARTSLPMPSRGSMTYSAQPPVRPENRLHVSMNTIDGRLAASALAVSSCTCMRNVTSGSSSLGMPTQITVRPSSTRKSITSPTRLPYSARHSALSESGTGWKATTPPRRVEEALGVVAAERDHDDVGIDHRDLLAQACAPVEVVGAGQAGRHLVVERRCRRDRCRRAGGRGRARTSRRRCRRRSAPPPGCRPSAARCPPVAVRSGVSSPRPSRAGRRAASAVAVLDRASPDRRPRRPRRCPVGIEPPSSASVDTTLAAPAPTATSTVSAASRRIRYRCRLTRGRGVGRDGGAASDMTRPC